MYHLNKWGKGQQAWGIGMQEAAIKRSSIKAEEVHNLWNRMWEILFLRG